MKNCLFILFLSPLLLQEKGSGVEVSELIPCSSLWDNSFNNSMMFMFCKPK
jgi:hypothetical protein